MGTSGHRVSHDQISLRQDDYGKSGRKGHTLKTDDLGESGKLSLRDRRTLGPPSVTLQISGWRSQQPCDLRLAQKKSFIKSLRAQPVSSSAVPEEDESIQDYSIEDESIPPEASRRHEITPPSIRKSPLSLPYSANIDLAQWYHAFLKRELICDRNVGPLGTT